MQVMRDSAESVRGIAKASSEVAVSISLAGALIEHFIVVWVVDVKL